MQQPFVWEKLGLVYTPPRDGSWREIYGQAPSIVRLPDRLRAFFAVRRTKDEHGLFKSDMSWVDLALDDPTRIIGQAPGPIVPFGRAGTFDEHGLMPSCAVWVGDVLRLYYLGWMRLVGVPYAVSIGLAESRDGGATFAKVGEGPMMSRTLQEPFQENGAFVLRDGDVWHMWYGSGTDWVADGGKEEAMYVIKYARSHNGVAWERDAKPIIQPMVELECQARPCVVKIGERWHMWFCYRYGLNFRNAERGYRIGYAWSDDLATWHRDDRLGGIETSSSGWDSESVSYPFVFQSGDDTYLLYNGNDFGEGGFGCATSGERRVVSEAESAETLATVEETYANFHLRKKSRHLYPTEWVIRTMLGAYPHLKLNTGGYAGAKLLDLGFGDCRNMPLLANCGFDLYGVEITESIVAMARETLANLGIAAALRVGTNAAIPFEDGFFDYLLACHSCYYVDHGTTFTDNLREMHRVLRPGGTVVASLPAPGGFIVSGARDHGDGHVTITNDVFGLRNGYVFRSFTDEADVVRTFGELFDDVVVGRCEDNYWGLQINVFLVSGRARK